MSLSTFSLFQAPSCDICGWDWVQMAVWEPAQLCRIREVQDHIWCCDMAVLTKGLTQYGLYYAGILAESQLDEDLKLHKSDQSQPLGYAVAVE